MSEPHVHPSFEQAEHPTAPNGQCPICYSEGYEDGAAKSKAWVLRACEIMSRLTPVAGHTYDDAVEFLCQPVIDEARRGEG